MELRSSQVRSVAAPDTKRRQLLLSGDAGSGGGEAAVMRFPDIRKSGGRITPQWVESALFDPSVARLLIGPSAELLWASKSAEDVIGRSGCLRIQNERLTGMTARAQAKLDMLIASARGDGTVEDLFAAADAGDRALFVAARSTPGPQLGTAALVLRETGRETTAIPDLTRLFGLTVTESHIVGLLLNGLSVAEIAVRQHNSELTVRTHLKRSYSKMNIRTKEQLFAKMLRLLTD